MPKKASTSDAQLILQLYDLRREAEMRKARAWWAATFWPQSAADIARVSNSFGAPENAWFRQVIGYWEMTASLVLHGALNEDLFFDTGGEMWFILAKVHPYLKQHREKNSAPEMFKHAEKLAMRTKQGRDRLQRLIKRVEAWRQSMAAAGKGS